MAELITGSLPPPEAGEKDADSPTPKVRGRGSAKYKINQLREPLREKLDDYFALPMSLASPLAGAYILDRNEKNANALLKLAENRPRFRAALERFVDGTSAADLLITGAGIAVCFWIDNQRIAPDSMPAHMFGIDAIFKEVYPDGLEETLNGAVKARGLGGEI